MLRKPYLIGYNVILWLIIPILPYIAEAQHQPSETALRVQKAIDLALENNPGLNSYREQIRAQQAQRLSSFGLQSPQLDYTREGLGAGVASGFSQERWTISQTLDFPVAPYYRRNRIDAEVAAYEQRLERKRRAVKAEVKMSFTELAYGAEILDLRNEQRALANALSRAVLTLVSVGDASELDRMRADILLAEAENDVSEAKRKLQQARQTLYNTLGVDSDNRQYDLQLPDTLIYLDIELTRNEVLLRLDDQPEMAAMSHELQAKQLGIKEAWGHLWPNVTIRYFRQNFGPGARFNGVEFGLSIPLWYPLEHRGRIQSSRAFHAETLWRQQEVRLDLKHQFELAWHDYNTSRQQILRHRERIQEQSQSLMALTIEGYEVGELDLISLLDVQRAYLKSQKRYLDTLRDYYFRLIALERLMNRDLVYTNTKTEN